MCLAVLIILDGLLIIFSLRRRDSFITHRAFCDALAQESARSNNNFPLQYTQNSSLENTHVSLPFPIKKEHQNLILKQEIPPWLSCSPIIGPNLGPPPHIELTTTPSSLIFQDFHQNKDFPENHHHRQSPNPNPSTSLGPTALPPYHHYHHQPPPPAHVSATALLQKAAQMGSRSSSQQFPSPFGVAFTRPHQAGHVTSPSDGFGQTRDQLVHGLASYADKASAMTGGGATPPSPLIHDQMIMMNNAGFHQGPEFSHVDFDQDHHRFHASVNQFSSRSGNEGDNLTRDFLGLRPLSQNDILSLTGFDSCINSNSCEENHKQTPKSW